MGEMRLVLVAKMRLVQVAEIRPVWNVVATSDKSAIKSEMKEANSTKISIE